MAERCVNEGDRFVVWPVRLRSGQNETQPAAGKKNSYLERSHLKLGLLHAVVGCRLPPPRRRYLSQTVHRANPDGLYDSICMKCFLTIGKSMTKADLAIMELMHVCDESLIAQHKEALSGEKSPAGSD